MPRTERAHSKAITLGARFSMAAAAIILLTGPAAGSATARPDPGQTVTTQATESVNDLSLFVGFRCTPIDTAVYDPMQDYVETLIWWHYHPDWRVA